MPEKVMLVLELFAVGLIASGCGGVLAASVGGSLGIGLGFILTGLVVLGASELSRWAHSRGKGDM